MKYIDLAYRASKGNDIYLKNDQQPTYNSSQSRNTTVTDMNMIILNKLTKKHAACNLLCNPSTNLGVNEDLMICVPY